MMLLPIVAGTVAAIVIICSLHFSGMAKDISSGAVVLVAIAAFYPVFAAENGELSEVIIHSIVLFLFAGCAWIGFKRSASIIAFGMIAHGLFDLALWQLSSPAPDWWHPFCAIVDVILGAWWYWQNSLAGTES